MKDEREKRGSKKWIPGKLNPRNFRVQELKAGQRVNLQMMSRIQTNIVRNRLSVFANHLLTFSTDRDLSVVYLFTNIFSLCHEEREKSVSQSLHVYPDIL